MTCSPQTDMEPVKGAPAENKLWPFMLVWGKVTVLRIRISQPEGGIVAMLHVLLGPPHPRNVQLLET